MSGYANRVEEIVLVMGRHGGAFAKALAKAYQCADKGNRAKIEATWREEFARYDEAATHIKTRQGGGLF